MKTYIIYEIKCLDTNITEVYIGSTLDFKSRKSQHKKYCNNINDKRHNLHIYIIIRENGGWDNWIMRPLEKIECETIMEAHIKEQYWIDKNQAKLNSIKAYITDEQRIERDKERKKTYYDENAEQIRDQKKTYYVENAEQIKDYQKIYRAENADKIKDKAKIYYVENAEQIKEKKKQKYECICGGKYTYTHKLRHNKSKKHIDFISKN